jgi:hypothetical protein
MDRYTIVTRDGDWFIGGRNLLVFGSTESQGVASCRRSLGGF